MNGIRKWNVKNRVRVGSETDKAPQIKWTSVGPM